MFIVLKREHPGTGAISSNFANGAMGIGNRNFGRATTELHSLHEKGTEVKRMGVRELEPDAEKTEREEKGPGH